ncbi:MAG: cobalamin-dependent protein [Ottowia sp.]|nr:cobalamin-dependent protein [Ottowia sp.]
MKVALVNVAHPAIGSRMAGEHLPPLGLLAIGGPLLDAGHDVQLFDGDFDNTPPAQLAEQVAAARPDAVLFGHSGSSSAQPVLDEVSRRVHALLPTAHIIFGGVYPTYHWEEILRRQPHCGAIVRGEGEETTLQLINALERGTPLDTVRGIAWRCAGVPVCNAPAPIICNLDAHRTAWELMGQRRYTYWGGQRAALYQLSRGCTHACTYCGQRFFWRKWRCRDPQKAAAEIAMLYREYGVRVINFADESPAENQAAWRAFLEALIAERLDGLALVGSIRAEHIVRDEAFLHLYRQAGFERFLLGLESYDEAVLARIQKGSDTREDARAIQLLRQHGILSMATLGVGFGDERFADFWRTLRSLLRYDPDQIQFMYATPHRWTPYYKQVQERAICQRDQRKWDYRHQVLAPEHMPPWAVTLCVKTMEAIMQARPRAIWRTLVQPDARRRAAMRWYSRIGLRVWFTELWRALVTDGQARQRTTVAQFWAQGAAREEAPLETIRFLPARAHTLTQ